MKNVVFFNRKFVPEEEAVVSIKTHALQYGTGCFEGIRAYYNEKHQALYAFRMIEHYKRLHNSAKILFISIPYSPEELCKITTELLEKNFEETDIYIRPVIYKTDSVVGNFNLKYLKDGLAIYTIPLGRYLTQGGIRATISSWRRISDMAIPARAKITGSYVNTALAKTESILNGYDEALLLDDRGHVVEGSAENIFMIKDSTVFTPPVSDDILVGITRETIILLLEKELKLNVVERNIDRTEIYQADEVFLVGTGAEVSPVTEIDKRTVGSGNIGPVSDKIRDIYSKLVHGELKNYMHFLTKIEKK
jgi:branched-chain amino acid aminotransferase